MISKLSLSKQQHIMIIVFFVTIITCPRVSVGYGYKRNEDPLITVFKSIIFHGKKNDWARVASGIESINDRINDVKVIFDVDLKSKFDAALAQHNFLEVVNVISSIRNNPKVVAEFKNNRYINNPYHKLTLYDLSVLK